MNDLRKPTSLLAGTNIIFSVGSFMFLYKRMEQLQNENIQMKKDIQALSSLVGKDKLDGKQNDEFIKDMYKDVESLKKKKLDEQFIDAEFKAIVDALENHDINVKLPSKSKKKPKKYHVSSSEESSVEETPKKKYKKKTKDELEDDEIINMMRLKRQT